MQQQEKTYPIPAKLVGALVGYLQARPWAEVNEFMFQLHQIIRPIDEAEANAAAQMQNGKLREAPPPA